MQGCVEEVSAVHKQIIAFGGTTICDVASVIKNPCDHTCIWHDGAADLAVRLCGLVAAGEDVFTSTPLTLRDDSNLPLVCWLQVPSQPFGQHP